MIVFPGVAITLAVFAFNLFGEGLRDWLDPKPANTAYTPSALRTSNTSMMRAPLCGPSQTNCQRPSL